MSTTSAPAGVEAPSPRTVNPRVNLRNPTPLSATQEGEVRELYHKRVRAHCAKEIKEFADCAVNRTVTATWLCRTQRLAMNSCMVAHATPEEEDLSRLEWFAKREERRRVREKEEREKEERRKEVIQIMKADEEKRRRDSSGGWWWKGS